MAQNRIKEETDALTRHIHILYACESGVLTAEPEKRTQAFGMRCYRRTMSPMRMCAERSKQPLENMTNS